MQRCFYKHLVFKEVGTEIGFKFYASGVDKDKGFLSNRFCLGKLENEDQTMTTWITLSGTESEATEIECETQKAQVFWENVLRISRLECFLVKDQ